MIARAMASAEDTHPVASVPPSVRGGASPEVAGAADALQVLRAEIERTDAALIATLAERMALAQRVGQVKQAHGRPVTDPAREAAVVSRAAALAREAGLPEDEVRAIYWRILAMSRRVQCGRGR